MACSSNGPSFMHIEWGTTMLRKWATINMVNQMGESLHHRHATDTVKRDTHYVIKSFPQTHTSPWRSVPFRCEPYKDNQLAFSENLCCWVMKYCWIHWALGSTWSRWRSKTQYKGVSYFFFFSGKSLQWLSKGRVRLVLT